MKGVSTRKVDDLVRALGIDGISKSEVPRMCKALDDDVAAFLSRPVEIKFPYVWLDATFHKEGAGPGRLRRHGCRRGRVGGRRAPRAGL